MINIILENIPCGISGWQRGGEGPGERSPSPTRSPKPFPAPSPKCLTGPIWSPSPFPAGPRWGPVGIANYANNPSLESVHCTEAQFQYIINSSTLQYPIKAYGCQPSKHSSNQVLSSKLLAITILFKYS